MSFRVVFVSQGPVFEASSSPFRLLRGYACLDSVGQERCSFVHHPLLPFARSPRSEWLRRCFLIAEEIAAGRPSLLALSLYCWNTCNLVAVARFVKDLCPGVIIVAGGPDRYGEAEHLLRRHDQLDVVLDGEGELAFQQLLHHYVAGPTPSPRAPASQTGLRAVPWASFREGDVVIRSGARGYLSDLNSIPSPILGVSAAQLSTRFYFEESPAVIVETSRGCPVNCAFCQYPKNDQGRMRYYDMERVLCSPSSTTSSLTSTDGTGWA